MRCTQIAIAESRAPRICLAKTDKSRRYRCRMRERYGRPYLYLKKFDTAASEAADKAVL
jgi:hypothetical protein